MVVQYDKDLLEVWDEAKRLRCEWFNDYEKTASKPPMVIADLDVVQLDFRGKHISLHPQTCKSTLTAVWPVCFSFRLASRLCSSTQKNDFHYLAVIDKGFLHA